MDFSEYEKLIKKDEKRIWKAVYIAVVFHLIIFFVQYNVFRAGPITKPPEPVFNIDIYVPPEPPEQKAPKQIQRTVFVPIPDPTPDQPELQMAEIPEDYWQAVDQVDDFLDYDDQNIMPEPQVMEEYQVSQPPEPMSRPQPVYPEIARAARVSGCVIAQIIVGTDGRVQSVKILRSIKGNFESFFNAEAVKALSQWRYTPALQNGMPVPVRIHVTLIFTLN